MTCFHKNQNGRAIPNYDICDQSYKTSPIVNYDICDQSYKTSPIVNYDSLVVM